MINTILHGDAAEKLKEISDRSIHCVITSPPYYGVRSYETEPQVWLKSPEGKYCEHEFIEETLYREIRTGLGLQKLSENYRGGGEKQAKIRTINSVRGFCRKCEAWKGELGHEPTPELYIEHLVSIFRGIKRVLRDDGTAWLNLGDGYWQGKQIGCFKPKDLMMIPHRAAIALQQDGWFVRTDIIWHKLNPLPRPDEDRPSRAHEYIILLSKSPRYYYDPDAVREYTTDSGFSSGRNRRTVWAIANEPYSGAHFAPMPSKLAEPCILAGTSEHGVCANCGQPYKRIIEKVRTEAPIKVNYKSKYQESGQLLNEGNRSATIATERIQSIKEAQILFPDDLGKQKEYVRHVHDHGSAARRITKGWQKHCNCNTDEVKPAVVLDPFFGAGTVGLVAAKAGRSFIGIELNKNFIQLAERRLENNINKLL